MTKQRQYTVIEVQGRGHVVVEPRPNVVPNYMGTGMGLCGVLRRGETLEGWTKRINKYKEKNQTADGKDE